MTPQIKTLLRILLVLAVAVGGYLIYMDIKHSGEAHIEIQVAPNDSLVTMDGKKLNSLSFYTNPGSHSFVASKNGFKDDSTSVAAIKGRVSRVYLLPIPNSPAAFEYLSKNPDAQKEREGIASQKVAQTQALLSSEYPILKYLPITTRYFSIDYGQSQKNPGDPTLLAFYIKSDPANRNLALDWMRYRSADPSKLEIIYQSP